MARKSPTYEQDVAAAIESGTVQEFVDGDGRVTVLAGVGLTALKKLLVGLSVQTSRHDAGMRALTARLSTAVETMTAGDVNGPAVRDLEQVALTPHDVVRIGAEVDGMVPDATPDRLPDAVRELQVIAGAAEHLYAQAGVALPDARAS